MRKAGEEEYWKKKKTGDRGGWRRIADKAVKSCRQHLTHDKGNKRKRERDHKMHDLAQRHQAFALTFYST